MTNDTNNMHLTDDQLFDLIDNSCTAEEQKRYKAHLAQCLECRALYEEYRAVDAQVSAIVLERAPEHFTEKLMEAWESSQQVPVAWAYRRSKSLFWAVAAAACTLLVIAFYYLAATQQVPAQVQQEAYTTISTKLPGLSLNINIFMNTLQQEWLMNTFLLLNGLLALMLFDKMVLKPFFEKKRQALAS